MQNTYYLGMEKRQGLVHILDFVNSHASVVGLGQSFAGYDLQQFEQLFAIREVGEQIVHLHARLKKIRSNFDIVFNERLNGSAKTSFKSRTDSFNYLR